MPRKQHRADAGYIAERMNPHAPGTKVVIYIASEQGIDAGGRRYAVVCNAHATVAGSASLPGAKALMKQPGNFCEACAALARA